MQKEEPKESLFPIDPDKVAENPHLLPYAHTIGGAVIRPIDKGRVKGRAVTAMYEQTDLQLQQIREQIELLAQQAQHIRDRVHISEAIYEAEMTFEPLIAHTYHLYQRSNGKYQLSLVGPREWGSAPPLTFIATVKMLADHTWEIVEGVSIKPK